MMCFTPGAVDAAGCAPAVLALAVPCWRRRGRRRRRAGRRRSAVSTAVADSTPGMARTACSQAWRSGSRRGAAGGSTSRANGDMAAAGGDAAHHAQRHDALAGRRVDDGFENLTDGQFADFRHDCLFPRPGNIVSPLDCGCCCRHIYAARREIKSDNAPKATCQRPRGERWRGTITAAARRAAVAATAAVRGAAAAIAAVAVVRSAHAVRPIWKTSSAEARSASRTSFPAASAPTRESSWLCWPPW